MIRVTMEDVARVRALLASPPPRQPAALTRRGAISLLEPDIAALRDQGYTLDQIATIVSQGGIKVSAAGLKTDLSLARNAAGVGRGKGRSGITRGKTPRKVPGEPPIGREASTVDAPAGTEVTPGVTPPATVSDASAGSAVTPVATTGGTRPVTIPPPDRKSNFTIRPDSEVL